MKVYKIIVTEQSLPINTLPIKCVERGVWSVGFLLYSLTKKSISKDYILHYHHGVLLLPTVKDGKEQDYSGITKATEVVDLFMEMFDKDCGLNPNIYDSAIDLDFELTDEEKRTIIEQLEIDEDGKYQNTVILE